MKLEHLLILIFFLTISCSDSKSEFEFDHSKVKLFAAYDAPLGAIDFVLFENNKFKIQRFELFERENFNGIAKIKGDSIYLEYENKKIDFKQTLLPLKMRIGETLIETELNNEPFYLVIRELSK